MRSGTGNSELDDPWVAGRAAAVAAVHQLDGADPGLVLVYASVRYELPQLLAGVRSVTGAVPLAGGTSCGHFADHVVTSPGSGVSVLVLAGGRYRFGVGSAVGLRADPESAGAALARRARAAMRAATDDEPPASEHPYAALLLFTDGIDVDQEAVLSGVHRFCGAAVPVVGGAAADDRLMRQASVFHDGEALTDAATGVWISSPRPLAVASAHGWQPISLPMLITRSDGMVIHEIGGRPAAEVFHAKIAMLREDQVPNADLPWVASYALGLIEPDGSHLVRGIFPSTEESVQTFTPLPAFSAVQVMTADPDTLLAVVDGVVERALTYGDETVLLAFDCIARMDILGARYPAEIARMNRAARGARCFGIYTYGEFARSKGVGGVHNATLTALAL